PPRHHPPRTLRTRELGLARFQLPPQLRACRDALASAIAAPMPASAPARSARVVSRSLYRDNATNARAQHVDQVTHTPNNSQPDANPFPLRHPLRPLPLDAGAVVAILAARLPLNAAATHRIEELEQPRPATLAAPAAVGDEGVRHGRPPTSPPGTRPCRWPP